MSSFCYADVTSSPKLQATYTCNGLYIREIQKKESNRALALKLIPAFLLAAVVVPAFVKTGQPTFVRALFGLAALYTASTATNAVLPITAEKGLKMTAETNKEFKNLLKEVQKNLPILLNYN